VTQEPSRDTLVKELNKFVTRIGNPGNNKSKEKQYRKSTGSQCVEWGIR
jgi:hypothetical protein